MTLSTLRLLPPLAIGRLGSAAEPLDNYRLVADPARPLELPKLARDRSLLVDVASGRIVGELPPSDEPVAFRHEGRIRPLAPFLEAFIAEAGSEMLRPLTAADLAAAGLTARWRVRFGNWKLYRRTGDPADRIDADTDWFTDHRAHPLVGHCAHFLPGKTLPMGFVQALVADEEHPEIRLRFTPADGAVYGSTPLTPEQRKALKIPPVSGNADWDVPAERIVYDSQRGRWHGHRDHDPVTDTLSQGLYAAYGKAPFFNFYEQPQPSRGFLDNAGDGEVLLELCDLKGHAVLSASARICAAPPIFAPDARFVRRLADDLIQVLEGPAHGPEAKVRLAEAEDIVRGAFQTVRFMNLAVLNGDAVRGRPNLADTMPADDAADYDRPLAPVMAPQSVDTWAILALHQQLLVTLRARAAPWFLRLLRRPEATGDLTDHGRRQMPALMSGADTNYLALTRRQIDTLRRAGEGALFDDLPEATEAALTPRNRTAQLLYRGPFNPEGASVSSSVGNCCPGLEMDFRSAWRRVLVGITLVEHNNYVVQADPEYAHLLHHRLLAIDGIPTVSTMRVPNADGSEVTADQPFTMEWSNTLALVWARAGQRVRCRFTREVAPDEVPVDGTPCIEAELEVRDFFVPDSAVIAPEIAEPGELTRGLCSPWQNDFRECVCYYWASSRPDYVNLEPTSTGSRGDNWMSKVRDGDYVVDDYQDRRLIDYADLFGNWEKILRFTLGGRDVDAD